MRRNSVDSRDIIRYGILLVALIFYEALSTIYYLMPPLFGFWFAVTALKKERHFVWLAVCYILFYEADHGLIIGSGCLFLYIYSRFALPAIEDLIISRAVITIVSIASAYLCYYALISLIYFIFGMNPVSFSWLFLYYIALESILATAALR
jgi:hypothetical protein